MLYTNYFNFQFSYLHTLYKPNNINTKPSAKVKTYIKIEHNDGTDKSSTLEPLWDIKDEERMEKLL